jgi:selenide,water dikinase
MTVAALPTLTSLSSTAGCAAKIAQADLVQALAYLPTAHDPRLLIGHGTGDDAAIFQLTDDLALVETVDIFTPIVDDPFDYGRIAAANALSDVYAMGGKPVSALSFVAWPIDVLGTAMLGEVLRGAASVCAQVGIVIAGGHSIVDKEPKFGLFVTGTVHPQRVVANSGARAGDVLVLTKPLGTGVLTTAVKRGKLDATDLRQAIDSMTTLNAAACEAMLSVGVHAATDVTGFGLLGHMGNLLRASSEASGRPLGAMLHLANVPWLDRAMDLAAEGICPGGSRRNLAFAAPHTRFSTDIPEHVQLLLADAQTSGGLLMAVPPTRLDALLVALSRHDVHVRAVIGEVMELDAAGEIAVV